MWLMILPFAAAIVFSAVSVGARAAENEPAAVVFASERIMSQWVKSYFGAIADGNAQQNECEAAIAEGLGGEGIHISVNPFSETQRRDARKFRAVFGRYGDVSSMPNDVAVRAAAIVNPDAAWVIACGVSTGAKRWRKASIPMNCADASCKAVDAATKRRIVTAAGRSCISDEGSAAPGTSTANVVAIREACRDVGGRLARKMAERH